MDFLRQLRYLLWKNYLIRKRQWLWLLVELIWPLCLFLILALIRTRDLVDGVPLCHYEPKALPSAGFLQFLQSTVCTLPNSCRNHSIPDASIGPGAGFNGSSFAKDAFDYLHGLARPLPVQSFSNQLVDTVHVINALQPYNLSLAESAVPIRRFFTDASRGQSDLEKCSTSPAAAQLIFQSSLSPLAIPALFLHVEKFMNAQNGRNGSERVEDIPDNMREFVNVSDSEGRKRLGRFINSVFCDVHLLNETLVNLSLGDLKTLSTGMCNKTDMRCFLINSMDNIQPRAWIPLMDSSLSYSTGLELTLGKAVKLGAALGVLMADFESPPFSTLLQLLTAFRPSNSTATLDYLTCGNITQWVKDFQRKGSKLEKMEDRRKHFKKEGKLLNETAELSPLMIEELLRNTTNGTICGTIPLKHPERLASCVGLLNELPLSVPMQLKNQLVTLMRGYILVGPEASPPLRRVLARLSDWFLAFEPARDALLHVLTNRREYLEAVMESDLGHAVVKTRTAVARINETIGPILHQHPNYSSAAVQMFGSVLTGTELANRFLTLDENENPLLVPMSNMLLSAVSCFSGQERFVLVQSQEEMETMGLCLQNYSLYYSGLFFDLPNVTQPSLPPATVYAIRMNSQLVDGTTRVVDRRWSMTARDRPLIDTKYTTYGFAYFQEIVDRAIIAEQTGLEMVNTSVFIQQFPQPCYTIDMFTRFLLCRGRKASGFQIPVRHPADAPHVPHPQLGLLRRPDSEERGVREGAPPQGGHAGHGPGRPRPLGRSSPPP